MFLAEKVGYNCVTSNGIMKLPSPSPTNFLQCREVYQTAKFRLRNLERELKIAIGVVYDYELERKLLSPSCMYGEHAPLASRFKIASIEFDRAASMYEIACEIQRQTLKKIDDNIPSVPKSK